jgi:two-component sensor histidine kinase
MDIDLSVAIGLIINELLTNALGHAFPEGRRGAIVVSMKRADAGLVELSVSDNGIGFPQEIDYRNPGSLGLRIVNILTQQVRGSLSLKRGEGTTFSVAFPSG